MNPWPLILLGIAGFWAALGALGYALAQWVTQ